MSVGNITSYPPVWPSAKFNSFLFQGTKYITRQEADLLYASTYSIRNIAYINDVTEGIASAQKALILDSSKNITGINNIQSATIDCNGLDINNSTDLNLYGTTNSIHLHSTTSSTIMMSGTIFNSITMQASSGFILMSGANQYVYLSGTSNYLRIDNNTASTSSTTGSLRIAGGAYFGNHCLYNGNITLQGLSAILSLSGASSVISISNTSASTSSTTGAIQCAGGAYFGANSLMAANLTLNGTSSTLSLSGASSVISISNTSASTSSTTGALRVAGGAYFGANSLFAGNVCIGGSTDTTRLISALNSSLANGSSNSICFGKANSSGNQAEFTYTVEAAAVNNKLTIGFHSNNLITMFNRSSGNVLYLGSTPTTATGCNVNILNTLALMDSSSNFAEFLYLNNKLNFNFYNSSFVLQSSYTFEGDCLKIGPSLLNNQFRLDLGSKGAISGNNDYLINLYNISLTSPTTGIGYIVDDNLFISSAGLNGIIFRNTNGVTGINANINRGTRTHQMYKSGHFEATAGIRAGEYSAPTFYSGKGVEIHWSTGANLGDVFAYDRTNSVFLPLRFNSTLTALASGAVGIGRTSPVYKLDVAGATRSDNYFLTTDTGAFGRYILNYAGSEYLSIGPYDGNNYRMAFRASDNNGIFSATYLATYAASFNTVSDYRSKENIEDLTYGLDKILQLKPKIYKLKGHFNDKNLGFIAHEIQEILPEIVEGDKDALDEMGNIKYQSVNTIELIPILVNAIQEQNKIIINNQKLIESLQNQLKEMQSDDETMYDMIEDIHKFLNISTE